VVSPEFLLEVAGQGPLRFKIAIHPTAVVDKFHGRGFKKAKGRGNLELKCESDIPAGASSEVTFCFRIGREDRMQPRRGPFTHDFSERVCAQLPKNQQEWDFKAAIDESGHFVVSLEVSAR
jgi:hypothetical protein